MTASPVQLIALTRWITAFAALHPMDLATHISEHLKVSRRCAKRLLAQLVAAQWLVSEGTQRRRIHKPGLLRQVVATYTLAGLEEDLPWARDFAPHFMLTPNVVRLVQYAFTELVNNAADHSGGSSVTVSMRQTASHVQLLVSDDGCGVFDHVANASDIKDPAIVAFELSKGKLTSAPQAHTGRGLFFSAKAADVFELHANASVFQHRSTGGARPLRSEKPRVGSSIFVGIALDTERSLDAVLQEWSADGAGYGFERTSVPLRLLTSPANGLESRAQARRAAHRLQQFRRVEIDFAGLEDVGHGFADELFRVWSGGSPQVNLQLLNMAPRVAALVASVRPETV